MKRVSAFCAAVVSDVRLHEECSIIRNIEKILILRNRMDMKLIERVDYLERLIRVIGAPDIKVITGIRRCGKSKLLDAVAHYARENIEDANVIRVNFNLLEFEGLRDYHALYEYVESRYEPNASNLVFVDEVQMCDGFERAINSLHASEKYDLFVTGSNAFLLSSDLATLFTGRTFEVEVFPFSLREYATYYGIADSGEAFDRYARDGGMPGSYVYDDESSRYAYIADVFDTLVLRDVKQKYRIRNTLQLERLSDYLMDNISNITSIRNIAAALGRSGLKITDKTAGAYVNHLSAAFAFYKVRRYDIVGKRYLSSGGKYYLADHSFRYAKLGTKNLDYGRVYENIVAIELIRRGWEVYVGTLYQKEIDFVVVRQNEKTYIQVSDDISGEGTFKRECEPLLRIGDAYPKMIIARTRHDVYTYEGIKVIDIAQWLMEN